MLDNKEIENKAYFYALKNGLEHGHKANAKAVLGKIMQEFPELKKDTKTAMAIADRVTEHVNNLTASEFDSEINKYDKMAFEKKHEERGFKLPPLPVNTSSITLRMAPFPSGSLHIGNARMIILNDEYVNSYGGRLLLVFDDTIGSDEKIPLKESYSLILEDLEWMGVKYNEIYYKSDRLEIFYKWGRTLIENGFAYACFCVQETLKNNRKKGIECIHRNFSVEENLKYWQDCMDGKFRPGEVVIRLKTSMSSDNPAFRDRVLFRISDRIHPRVGNRYKLWPLLEFSWAIDDVLLGITHVIRGKDLVIEDEMEKYIWNLLGWKGPEFIHYGMLRIAEAKLSKSKSMKEVKSGAYIGWDDPRTWSLSSLRRRGILPETIRNFVLSFGMSLSDIEVPAENLYSENRKSIDVNTPRYMYVESGIECTIKDLPEEKEITVPLSPDNPALGIKKIKGTNKILIAKEDLESHRGDEIRLKDFCNVKVPGDYNINDLIFVSWENKKLPRIQWVNAEHKLPCSILAVDGTTKSGVVEDNILSEHVGRVVQFERVCFARIDKIEKNYISCWYSHP